MSDNVKQIGGAIIGGTIGFFLGGPVGALKGGALGYSIGTSFTTTELDAVEGPRLDSMEFQTGDYDQPIKRIYGGGNETAGNLVWLKDNKIKETEHRRNVETGGKGGGGTTQTQITFTYSATFAIGLSDGPIGGISKIYADNVLIYDGSSTSASTVTESALLLESMTFYIDGSNNEIDPLIEAEQGSDIPAMRNISYVVFDDFQLENYGDRIPNFRFVLVDTISGLSPEPRLIRSLPNAINFPSGSIISGSGSGIDASPWYYESGVLHALKLEDGGAGTVEYFNPVTVNFENYTNVHKMSLLRINSDNTGELLSEEAITLPVKAIFEGVFNRDYSNVRIYPIQSSPALMLISWKNTQGDYRTAIGTYQTNGVIVLHKAGEIYTSTRFFLTEFVATYAQGKIYLASSGAFTPINVWQQDGVNGMIQINTTSSPTSNLPGDSAEELNEYLLNSFSTTSFDTHDVGGVGADQLSNRIFVIDSSTGLILTELDDNLNTVAIFTLITPAIAGDIFVRGSLIVYKNNAGTFSVIGLFAGSVIELETVETSVEIPVIVRYSQFVFFTGTRRSPWTTGLSENQDIFANGENFTDNPNITVRKVLENELSRNPFLDSGEIDLSEIANESIGGYAITDRSSLASVIKPLMQAYQFGVYEADYQIKFRSRTNGSNVATITTDDLQAHELGSEVPDEAVNIIKSDYKVPALINVGYRDSDREFETASQQAERLNTISNSQQDVNLPMSLTASKAATIADILLQDAWLEAQGVVSIRTSFKYSYLEREDLITVITSTNTYNLRIIDIEKGKPGVVIIKGVLSDINNYASGAVGETGNIVPATLTPISACELLIFDTVALRNNDEDYGFYYGVYPSNPSGRWGGASVTSSTDFNKWVSIATILNAVTNGTGTDTLTGAGVTTGVFDLSQTLNIQLASGALSSATDVQVRAGTNTVAYGQNLRWEIIKFQTALLEANGTYTISNLIRGYYGTEIHMSQHVIGDKFVVVDEDTSRRLAFRDSTLFNVSQYYKAISFGRVFDKSRAAIHRILSEARIHRAPVHIKATRASDVINITWIRSKRVNREWPDVDWTTTTVFNFEVDILSGAGGSVKRTINESGSADFNVTYTTVQQVTDFGSVQSQIYVNIYQTDTVTLRGKEGQGLAI